MYPFLFVPVVADVHGGAVNEPGHSMLIEVNLGQQARFSHSMHARHEEKIELRSRHSLQNNLTGALIGGWV